MESATLTVSLLLTILSCANDVYQIASKDQRLYNQLQAFAWELKNFDISARNVAVSGLLESHEVLDKFNQNGKDLQRKLEGFVTPSNTKNGKRTFGLQERKNNKTKDLSDLARRLQRLNSSLGNISPPLPPSYEESVQRAPQSVSPNRNSIASLAENTFRRFTASGSVLPPVRRSNLASRRDIQSLWEASTVAFRVMAAFMPIDVNTETSTVERIRDRIYLWGSGLFRENELHLDALISEPERARKEFGEPLLSRFVEIVMAQVSIIERWTRNDYPHGYNQLKEARVSLRAALIRSDMTQKLLEDFLCRKIEEDSDESDLTFVGEAVELLYDYLPIINLIRKRHILNTPQPTSRASTIDRPTGSVHSYIEENLRSLKDLEKMLKKREEDARTEDPTTLILSSLASKERQRLAEWSATNKKDPKPDEKTAEIEALQQNLSNIMREIKRKLADRPSSPSKRSPKRQPLTAEEEKRIMEGKQLAKEAIDRFADFTSMLASRTP